MQNKQAESITATPAGAGVAVFQKVRFYSPSAIYRTVERGHHGKGN